MRKCFSVNGDIIYLLCFLVNLATMQFIKHLRQLWNKKDIIFLSFSVSLN